MVSKRHELLVSESGPRRPECTERGPLPTSVLLGVAAIGPYSVVSGFCLGCRRAIRQAH